MHTLERTTPTSLEYSGVTLAQPFGLAEGQAVAVSIAHPDDEFLIGQALATLVATDHPVTVFVATDGTASTKGNPDFVRSGYRRLESQAALGAYGIAAPDQHYVSLEDGALHHPRPLAHYAQAMANRLLGLRPAMLLTTGHGFGHPDHRAAHSGALAASQIVERLTGASIPVWGLSERPDEVTFAVNPQLKLGRLALHATQFQIWLPDGPPKAGRAVDLHGYKVSPHSRQELTQYDGLLQWEPYARY